MTFVSSAPAEFRACFTATDYDLSATLSSGQTFRWEQIDQSWEGVMGRRWVKLWAEAGQILAETCEPVQDWEWLRHYLQIDLDVCAIVETFPRDKSMAMAVAHCAGLRLLRQDPWECLASFILSSTKQIVQIQQIVRLVSERFGEALPAPPGRGKLWSFPSATRLAEVSEAELRACKMGFRAPYLKAAANMVASRRLCLDELNKLGTEKARAQLLEVPGVGRKIADCVLLFAYGSPDAFPVDVWVKKALQELYFRGKSIPLARLQEFARTHFGPHAGYAQQYLFHYMRTRARSAVGRPGG